MTGTPATRRSHARFKEVQPAYDILSDPERRQELRPYGFDGRSARSGVVSQSGYVSFDFEQISDLGGIIWRPLGEPAA